MFFAEQIDNNIYIGFQDTSLESKELYKNIKNKLYKPSKTTLEKIKEFLEKNEAIDSNARRQKNYISHLKTYIDIVEDKQSLVLNIYVMPKDLDVVCEDFYNKNDLEDNIKKYEYLSFEVFRLYNELMESKKKNFNAFDAMKGKNFVDYEFDFYLNKLNELYNYLLNYKRTLKDKIIVSDKKVGIEIEDLTRLEANKLKIYQFVKVPHQNDLIIFIFSLIKYLKDKRLVAFEKHCEIKKLNKVIDKINDFLRKISTSKHIHTETIRQKTLNDFFTRYKNSKEIQKNLIIYQILEVIFSSQLKNSAFIFQTIDMAKMFEQVVENSLISEFGNECLNIGDETKKCFTGPNKEELEKRKYLLDNKTLPQYPDFLVKENNTYHIVDAKYKTEAKLWKDSNAFRQIIVYAKLFNKGIAVSDTEKRLVFAKVKKVDLKSFTNLHLNVDYNQDLHVYNEYVFDGKITIQGIPIFK